MLKRSDRGQRNLNKKLQKVPRNLVQQKLPLTVEMSPIIDMNDVVTFLSFSFRADVVFGFLFRELLLFLVVSKLQ